MLIFNLRLRYFAARIHHSIESAIAKSLQNKCIDAQGHTIKASDSPLQLELLTMGCERLEHRHPQSYNVVSYWLLPARVRESCALNTLGCLEGYDGQRSLLVPQAKGRIRQRRPNGLVTNSKKRKEQGNQPCH